MAEGRDTRLAEMLASRLCHDLAGPLAAVANGMELLSDPDFGPDPEAIALVESSSVQATASLRFLRSAFGVAGEREGQPAHLRAIATDWLRGRRVTLEWGLTQDALPPEVGRLLLNLVCLAAEALPRGGVIAIAGEAAPAARRFILRAEGEDLHLRPELQDGLDAGEASGLGPRAAQAYFFCRLADSLGGALDVAVEAGTRLSLQLTLRG